MTFTNFFRKARTLIMVTALAATICAFPAAEAHAQVGVEVAIAPPPIPAYDQPVIPGDGYIWTPGYWAYGPDGYYWVDGAWVYPPYVGGLWTPGWWGFGVGGYFWHPGYWGRTVGYYGGINYGFGYFGVGFYGGYWNGGHFFYNRAYGHFGPGFHGAFYNRPYAGFNGRPGGSSFNAHPPAQFASFHGGASGAAGFNHGSTINGNNSFHGAPANTSHSTYAGNTNGYRGSMPAAENHGASPGNYHASAPASHPSAPAAHPSAPSGGGHFSGGGGHFGGGHSGGGRR